MFGKPLVAVIWRNSSCWPTVVRFGRHFHPRHFRHHLHPLPSIYTLKTVKFDHFATGSQFFIVGADADPGRGLFQFRITHLAGDGSLPDPVHTVGSVRIAHGMVLHIGGGWLRGLPALSFYFCNASTGTLAAIAFVDFLFNGIHGRIAQAYAVGTHIGDLTRFVELLGKKHGFADTVTSLRLASCCRVDVVNGCGRHVFPAFTWMSLTW